MPPKAKSPEIKVRPTAEEKEAFEKAAELSRRSLNTWAILAMLEKAERDGVKIPGKKGGSK